MYGGLKTPELVNKQKGKNQKRPFSTIRTEIKQQKQTNEPHNKQSIPKKNT